VRFVDFDGNDWKDKVVGYAVGVATNVIPFSTGLRNQYTPTDPSDYNGALRAVDETSLAVGTALTTWGSGLAAAGAGTMLIGGTTIVASGGAAAIEGGAVAVAGAEAITIGAKSATVGLMLMGNSTANSSAGYEHGKEASSSQQVSFIQGSGEESKIITVDVPDGYRKVKRHSHGQKIYTNGKDYISPDKDGHNEGVWKRARSIKDLDNRKARMGTYDVELNRIGD
jgi:hypothetical protein